MLSKRPLEPVIHQYVLNQALNPRVIRDWTPKPGPRTPFRTRIRTLGELRNPNGIGTTRSGQHAL